MNPSSEPSAASNDGKPVPVESLLDEDDFAVIAEDDVPAKDMPGTSEVFPAACDHDWRDIDGRWLCIECRAEKPYASDAAKRQESETRWTAFEGEHPVAHAEARFMAERIAKERGFTPTKYVKRERAYPFKHLETFTVATGTWTSHV